MRCSARFLRIVCCWCVLACAWTADARSEEPFKLGALLCLTGPCAEWGNNSLKGIELAVEDLNHAGGILGRKVVLAVQDSKEASGGANSVTALRQLLLDPEVRYIIGSTWSIGGLPIAPLIAARKDTIVTSPSVGVAEYNETADNIFNTWPHDSYSTEALARYAIENGMKKIAILSGNDPWVMTQGNTFEKEFTKLGGTISVKIEVEPKVVNVSAESLKIKSGNPDAVFYADTYNMSGVARHLRDFKYTGKQLAILMDDTRVQEAQGALDQTVFAQYPEAAPSFREAYEKKHGVKPGITSDTAYDAVMVYSRSITAAKTFDPAVVKQEMLRTEFDGVSGRVVFDGKGGVVRKPAFFKVEGQKFEIVDSKQASTGR